jgi:PTH2 family peptidyl-tRNA hydrolase
MIENPTFYIQMKENIDLGNSKSTQTTTSQSNQSNQSNQSDQYKMVIAVREDLKMGRGKIAAQVGHAVLGAYKKGIKDFPELVQNWEKFSGQAKIVVSIKSEEHLLALREKASQMNLPFYLVRDAGRTQVEAGTITVCAFGPGKVEDINTITGHLDLL